MSTPAVGSATAVITPPLGASVPGGLADRANTGVHDDLLARAAVLEVAPPLGLLALDCIALPRDTVLALREAAAQQAGIPTERLMVTATHTHHGGPTIAAFQTPRDEDYLGELIRRSAEALARARESAQPCCLAVGTVSVPGLQFNRRYWMRDGTLRTNPGLGNPDALRPAGPVNPKMHLFAFRPTGGGPLTLVVNFALHAATIEGGAEISADYPGVLTRALQEALGPETVVLFLNGACGDINHWDVLHSPPPAYQHEGVAPLPVTTVNRAATERSGLTLAQVVLDLLPSLDCLPDWTAAEAHTLLPAAVRQPDPQAVARAQAAQASGQVGWPQTQDEVYDWEALQLARLGETRVDLEIQALRLGSAALLGIPAEVFTQIGLDIEARSPHPTTAVVELANGWEGYLPTEAAFAEGGYETLLARSSKLAPDTAGKVVEAALSVLARV
jgi:neutral ceramidase